MADETVFAVLDADGVVINKIVAGQEFIDTLIEHIADPDIDSGEYDESNRFVDITDRDPQPNIGWARAKNGRFIAPVPPEPTAEEVAAREQAEAEASARADDDAFLAELDTRVRGGGRLTQDERDRMDLIRLRRT